MPGLIVHPAFIKKVVFDIFAGSWADKLGYRDCQGPIESWGKVGLYCPGCGAKGLWRTLALEGSNTAICPACGNRFEIRRTTPTTPDSYNARAHQERLAKLRLAEADIEIRTGAGTKGSPHEWLPAIAGRRTPTRLFYRWPDDPANCERGPVRLDCQGKTWQKKEIGGSST